MRRDVTVFRGGEIDKPLLFIDAFKRTHFPFAVSHLSQEFAIRRVVIEMFPTAALAGP